LTKMTSISFSGYFNPERDFINAKRFSSSFRKGITKVNVVLDFSFWAGNVFNRKNPMPNSPIKTTYKPMDIRRSQIIL
jgi:hypothetical protein